MKFIIPVLTGMLVSAPAWAEQVPGCANAEAMQQSRIVIEQQLAAIALEEKDQSQKQDQVLKDKARAAGWDDEKQIKVMMSIFLMPSPPDLEQALFENITVIWDLEAQSAATSWEKNPALACSLGWQRVNVSLRLRDLNRRKSEETMQRIKEAS